MSEIKSSKSKQEPKKPANLELKSQEHQSLEGKHCYYARFHQGVPPYVNKEPVSEFRIETPDKRYKVDSIIWTKDGIIFKAGGELGLVPCANVMYVRFIQD